MEQNLKKTSPADTATPSLIMRLADRVRSARTTLGMPRRELSDRSNVSPRYLAQLESGEGNISILLLQRVAEALDLTVEDLVREAAPMDRTSRDIAALFMHATPEVQSQVRQLLLSQSGEQGRAERICLIGVRGAGKSTLGRKAALALNIPFIELRDWIEDEEGRDVAQIMQSEGAPGYRRLEAKALKAVAAAHSRVIVTAGGGVVDDAASLAALRGLFHTIWVRTSPAEHIARVRAQRDDRLTAAAGNLLGQLKQLLEARDSKYAQADAVVNTANRPEQSSVNDVLAAIATHRFIEKRGP